MKKSARSDARWVLRISLLLSVVLTVFLMLIESDYFIAWILLISSIYSLYLFIRFKNRKYRFIWINLFVIFLAIGIFETLSAASFQKSKSRSKIRYEGEYTQGYFIAHDFHGYAPPPGKRVRSKKYRGQTLLYDVTYTISPDGLRVSPLPEAGNSLQCAVFFGDSFTFGEGVEDNETMPYQVGLTSNYDVYNFGFHGYGPHQMLAAIEFGLVEEIVKCRPNMAVFQTFEGHVARSAGYSSWDAHGPKYALTSNGSVAYEGRFDDGRPIIYNALMQIRKSAIYKKFFKNKFFVKDRDVELFLAIVEASREGLLEKYPGLKFYVVYWDRDSKTKHSEMIIERFREINISLHLISDILPDFFRDRDRYRINPRDDHPNSVANRLIATYLAETVFEDR